MRIVLVSHLFPKASDRRHGIFVQRQAERLRDLGHDIEVVVPVPFVPPGLTLLPRWKRYRRLRDPHPVAGFRVHLPAYVRPPGQWFLVYEPTSIYLAIRRQIRRLHHSLPRDIVFTQDFSKAAGAAARAAHDAGLPCVGMAIGDDVHRIPTLGPRHRRTIVTALRACDAIVCNSHALAEQVHDLTGGRCTGVVITRGVDVHRFAPPTPDQRRQARQHLRIHDDHVVLLYAGYLQRSKGVFDLLDAFARIADAHPRALLLLAGDGADRDELARRAAPLVRAGRVRLAGHVDHDLMPLYCRAADIAVMLSWSEGMPNAVVEAIASGLPVVATAVGGTPEAVCDGLTGLLVPSHDVPAAAEALDRLVRDADLRRRFGERARRHALEHFDATANARRLADLLADVAARYRCRSTPHVDRSPAAPDSPAPSRTGASRGFPSEPQENRRD